MQFKTLGIDDRSIFKDFFSKYNPVISELTFTNLFMWRHYYNYEYTLINGFLCLIAKPNNSSMYSYIPIGSGTLRDMENVIQMISLHMIDKGEKPVFKKVQGHQKKFFSKFIMSTDDIVYSRDSSDYVYKTDDLINLNGKKYHSKRNHINKFVKSYEFEYIPIDSTNINECKSIMKEWCKFRDCECMRGEFCEKFANNEVINNYNFLNVKGAIITVNGKSSAFTVGEMLNTNTAVIHLEKAAFDINGLYTYINREFCLREWKHTEYINREQDLGQEGLRKAKLSYNPCNMVNKYTVRITL